MDYDINKSHQGQDPPMHQLSTERICPVFVDWQRLDLVPTVKPVVKGDVCVKDKQVGLPVTQGRLYILGQNGEVTVKSDQLEQEGCLLEEVWELGQVEEEGLGCLGFVVE